MPRQDFKKQLSVYVDKMSAAGQHALLDYAKFLASEHPAQQDKPQEPLTIARPQDETVVAAIRRLTQTYPMLDRQLLLHETSGYMMQHVMQGRDAVTVIDDLELCFRRQYQNHIQQQES